ncbi:hypothetical protein CMV_029815 [Castanea mollissima]|uniref:Peptidase A1 domain-containing protein n=1 Tax=Castanea mollissima TaxID=60419 RepID=A0A8J4VD17_9ROSI|nr:hypothetical protein CMV_029815 [Castanea mollissima]
MECKKRREEGLKLNKESKTHLWAQEEECTERQPSRPSTPKLYFAKLGLGSPPKDYYVQVDTGSDILWVNCVGCKSCPKKSGLGALILFAKALLEKW